MRMSVIGSAMQNQTVGNTVGIRLKNVATVLVEVRPVPQQDHHALKTNSAQSRKEKALKKLLSM